MRPVSESDREAYVGRPLKRTEDPRLITGRGQYVEDIKLPGLAHLAFLRSPHAHARVAALRTDAARRAPGVVRVVTARDLGPLRPLPFMAMLPGLKQVQCPYLAEAVVDSTGVPVAAVVAESPSLARDAAELIEVDYEPLPAVADPERGLEPGAPLAHSQLGTNQAFSWPLKGGDVDGAFSRAAHIVKVRLDHNRLAGAPMEPRGVLARYDPGSDELTLWLTTQNPFLSRADLAAVTGFPEHKLRVIAPDVGGGFGVKGPLYREEIVAATLARQLGRPIRWISTRTEDLLTTIQARAAVSEAEGAVTADGELIGLRAKAVFDLGAHLLGLSLVPPMYASTHIFGPYRSRNAELLSIGVYTNTAPTGPYRGSGRPVGVYLIERLMDEAARATRLDPVEIRRRNFISPEAFPHRTPFGVAYDSGNYARALDRVVELADYRDLRRAQAFLLQPSEEVLRALLILEQAEGNRELVRAGVREGLRLAHSAVSTQRASSSSRAARARPYSSLASRSAARSPLAESSSIAAVSSASLRSRPAISASSDFLARSRFLCSRSTRSRSVLWRARASFVEPNGTGRADDFGAAAVLDAGAVFVADARFSRASENVPR